MHCLIIRKEPFLEKGCVKHDSTGFTEQVYQGAKKEEPPPKSSDDWAHDPTEEEPDDNEVAPPMIDPEEIQERTVTAQADHDVRFRTNIERKEREEADRQERTSEEKIEMTARIEALQQELT